MPALTRAVFGTWPKNNLAEVCIFPTTLWMKSIFRVSRFRGLLEHFHGSFTQTCSSGLLPPALVSTTQPVSWSLCGLWAKRTRCSQMGARSSHCLCFFCLSWNRHLQSKYRHRTKFTKRLCAKFRTLCSCVTFWNSSSSPEAMLLLILLSCTLIMIF